MKKILLGFMFLVGLLTVACQDKLPQASFNLHEVKSFTAQIGDQQVVLNWEVPQGASPIDYLILWTTSTEGAQGGEKVLEPDKTTLTVDKLINDAIYQFSIQPRYPDGVAGKVVQRVIPKNVRFAVENLKADAGTKKVRLTWRKPASNNLVGYTINVSPSDRTIEVDQAVTERFVVDQLTNGIEYTFAVTARYTNGLSTEVSVKATPGAIEPILVASKTVVQNNAVKFTHNDMYFIGSDVLHVSWLFGTGDVSTELSPSYAYPAAGTYTVTATVTYVDQSTESATIEMTVEGYKWSSKTLSSANGKAGTVKVSNPVFSHDGQTLYMPISNTDGDLFAVDVVSGDLKWSFPLPLTYGGGPMVGGDGVIYQGAADGFYAIKADGSQKWKAAIGKVEAFPAINGNVVYCVANSSPAKLYALDATTGETVWSADITGTNTGCAVAVTKSGKVIVGTNGKLKGFSAAGVEEWSHDLNISERGSFAFGPNNKLYAALSSSSANTPAGLVQLDAVTGALDWTYATTTTASNGACYFPVVDATGVVYFAQRGGRKVIAVNADGTRKWETAIGAELIYTGLALSADGVVYAGTQGKSGATWKFFGVNTADGALVVDEAFGSQMMSAFTFGPDARLYWGVINGTGDCLHARNVESKMAPNCWAVRGGDLQGTNKQK